MSLYNRNHKISYKPPGNYRIRISYEQNKEMLPQTENACIQRAEGAFPYSATADTEMERSGIEVAGRSESTKYQPKNTIIF